MEIEDLALTPQRRSPKSEIIITTKSQANQPPSLGDLLPPEIKTSLIELLCPCGKRRNWEILRSQRGKNPSIPNSAQCKFYFFLKCLVSWRVLFLKKIKWSFSPLTPATSVMYWSHLVFDFLRRKWYLKFHLNLLSS